jgi:hypothetical protein
MMHGQSPSWCGPNLKVAFYLYDRHKLIYQLNMMLVSGVRSRRLRAHVLVYEICATTEPAFGYI